MKSQLIQTTVLATFAALTLNACSNNSNTPQNKSLDLNAIQKSINDGSASPTESAEELALAAEQLAQSASFMYASKLAKVSLAIDPTNVRAKFWSAVIAPTMELKGIVTRLEPLAQKNPTRLASYEKTKRQIQDATPIKAVRDFMFKGPKDIQSEDEIQDTISRVTAKMDELRQTLKSLKGEELTIYRNPETVTDADSARAAQESCSANAERGVITLHGCDISAAYQVKLNGADFEVMQQAVAGYQVYVGVLNSYSIHGAINVSEKAASNHGADIVAELAKDPKFGTLQDKRSFAVVPEVALDAVLAARSALQLQKQLCSGQSTGKWSRPGYLFGNGSCELPTDGYEAALQTIEAMAKGPANMIFNVEGQAKSITMDVPAFSKAPVSDLRTLIPTQTNRCGEPTAFADPTISGLFPNGDVATLFQTGCH